MIMHGTSKTYSIESGDTLMLNEAAVAYANLAQPDKRRVNTQELIDGGYMTLDQSKALIEKKIHKYMKPLMSSMIMLLVIM